MNARYIARRVARIIAAHGETMTLKRAGETDLPLKGKRFGGGTEEIGGAARQQTFRVRIAPTELAASAWTIKEPKRKDALVIAGRTRSVEDVRPISDGDTVALYELEVAG